MTARARGALLRAAFTLWKRVLGPLVHAPGLPLTGGCRFQPSCSEYATLAFAVHGPFRGAVLAAWRLLRCNPFGRGGWDPVPLSAKPSTPAIYNGSAASPNSTHHHHP